MPWKRTMFWNVKAILSRAGLWGCFFFSSRRRHTRYIGDWSSDVCSSDLAPVGEPLDERGYWRDVAESQPDAADDARAEPEEPELVDVHPEGGNRQPTTPRSEERRVGKECRARTWSEHERKTNIVRTRVSP